MKILLTTLLCLFLGACAVPSSDAGSALVVEDLRCESLASPLGARQTLPLASAGGRRGDSGAKHRPVAVPIPSTRAGLPVKAKDRKRNNLQICLICASSFSICLPYVI